MSKVRTSILVLALPVVFIGVRADAQTEKPKAKKDCIVKREINVMSPLDDKHVYVKARSDNHYLLTMDAQCPGLSLARKLAISDTSTRVCEGGTSLLSFEEPSVGAMRCRIDTITPVASKMAAQELIESEAPPK
jgi:hypothetical protein